MRPWPSWIPSLLALAALALATPAEAIGILVPTHPGTPPIALVYHRVEATVVERGARTKVIQEFQNPTGRPLEATYLFPLPKGATVDEFALWMNGRRETGKILEQSEARRIYESIVQRTRDPGLIEYVDSELFQARVFPVPPNGRMKVELIYSHLVPYEGGVHRYVYPMKTDANASSTLEDFTLTVRVESKMPILNVYSPTHKVATTKKGGKAAASFEKNAFSLADDFALYWSVDDAEVGLTLLTYQEGDEPGYFLLLASPSDGMREQEIIGKRVSFVVDTSGSMAGEKMDAVKAALDYCLSRLGEDDLFNVISFGGFVEAFEPKMVAASRENVERARTFVKNLEPLGGTNIDEALKAALEGATGSEKVPHMVVFLTDGRPTVGETDPARILEGVKARVKGTTRIFSFGVGEDVNTLFLDKLAAEHGGTSTYLEGDATAEAGLKAFYDRISHPVLSGLSLDIDGVYTFGLLPRKVPDLFAGDQLVVLGRYRKGGEAKVQLTGQARGGKRTYRYRARFARGDARHAFIPRLWAQRQVAMLLEQIREQGETPGLVEEVTQLATAFGIVTPYTSYLVVEPGTAGAQNRPQPPPFGGPRMGGRGDAEYDAPAKSSTRARKMLREESGEGAVAAAKEIGRLRESTVASERKVRTTMARAMGRIFSFDGAFFVDEQARPQDKTFAIRPFSDAYFLVLSERPDLKEALALADHVKVRVADGRVLIVSPDAPERVDEAALRAFLKR